MGTTCFKLTTSITGAVDSLKGFSEMWLLTRLQLSGNSCDVTKLLKPIFHLATLFARREAKRSIRQRDWLKLAGEKIRREQVGTVPTFLCVRANKFAKWKIGLTQHTFSLTFYITTLLAGVIFVDCNCMHAVERS